MIRNGMGTLPISVHPGTKNKLLVDAIGLKVTGALSFLNESFPNEDATSAS